MLTKNVNGKEVLISPEEEAEILADWEANDPAKNPAPAPQPTVEELQARIDALQSAIEAKGIAVPSIATGV